MSHGVIEPETLPRVEAVVVGASAGGVEALLSIFGELPRGFELPIIVVLHLPDERRSQLAEVFAKRVALPVKEAEDKESVTPAPCTLPRPVITCRWSRIAACP